MRLFFKVGHFHSVMTALQLTKTLQKINISNAVLLTFFTKTFNKNL